MLDLKSAGKIAGTVALGAGKAAAQMAKTGSETALAVISIVQTRVSKNPRSSSAVAGAGLALAAVGGVATGIALTRQRDFHRAGRTASGPAAVFNVKDATGKPVRVLRVGGVYQSATYLDDDTKYLLPFAYYRAFDVVFQQGFKHDRLLMLGGGGCTFAKHVLAEDNTTCIDVIEPDAEMTRIAREYFFLDDAIAQFDADGKRLHLIASDGKSFLRRRAELSLANEEGTEGGLAGIAGALSNAAKQFTSLNDDANSVPLRYDAIINDAFSGKKTADDLLSPETLADAKACLNEDGLYLINVADPGRNDENLQRIMGCLATRFTSVHVLPCPDMQFGAKDCCLLIATDGEYCFAGETQVQVSEIAEEA